MSSDEGLKQLVDVSTFISRGITPAYVDAGGVTVINQKCIRNGNVDLSQARKTDPNKKRIPIDKFLREFDILVNSTGVGTLGRVGQIFGDLGEITADSHVTIVRPDANKVDPTYLGYVLKSLQRNIEALAEGSTGQTELSRHKLGELLFLDLDISEQKAVGHLCKTLDDRITLLLDTNVTLEAIAQAVFKSWFVDFDPVRAKAEGKQPEGMDAATAALFPDSFEETELSLVPKGWGAKGLDEIANYLNGLALQKYPPTGADDLPVIKIAQLRKGDTTGADMASRGIKPDYIVNDGDVLFSWSGTLEVEIWCGGEGALNQHLFKVTSSKFPKWFYYLWTKYHLQAFRQIAADKATTMGHIQRVHLSEAKAFVPTDAVIESADAAIEPIFERMIVNATLAKTLTSIRDTLLPRLISGQLSLSSAKQMAGEII